MGISIVCVFFPPRSPSAHSENLQTSIVVDKDWNPLLQDFRLSKVFVTDGIKLSPSLTFFPRLPSTYRARLQ